MYLMSNKKICPAVLAVTLALSAGTAFAANSPTPSSAKVSITATVVASTCTAGWDSAGVAVDLGKVASSGMVNPGDIGASKPFSLSLTGCTGITKVDVSASGTPDGADDQAFANTGSAKGVAVELFGGDGQTGQLTPNNATSSVSYAVTDGDATLPFLAKLERTAAANADETGYAAGDVSSVANLSLTYE